MSILNDQAPRLLRTEWSSATELAQELFSMFSADTPLQITGPVQLTNPTNDPAIQVQNTGADAGTTPPFSLQIGGAGAIDLNPGSFEQAANPPQQPTQGGGLAGFILAGSGSAYTVQLVSGQKVKATQLQIDPSETIPPGTGCLVVSTGGKFYISVPVWL